MRVKVEHFRLLHPLSVIFNKTHPQSLSIIWVSSHSRRPDWSKAGGKANSERDHCCWQVHSSERPSRLKPSAGLLSESIHSTHNLAPKSAKRTWLAWAKRWTSSSPEEARIIDAAAASLSMNHNRSWSLRSCGCRTGITKAQRASPGYICWCLGFQLAITCGGTSVVPPHPQEDPT